MKTSQRRGAGAFFALAAMAIGFLQCGVQEPVPRISTTRQAIDYVPPGHARKICQLSGMKDRFRPNEMTGALRGDPSTVTGTDIGYAFEQGNHVRFLFGDTHEFSPDFCEPAWCGTQTSPKNTPMNPDGEQRVKRAPSEAAFAEFVLLAGDGAESSATAPLDMDLEGCPPLTFESKPRGVVVAHSLVEGHSGNIGGAIKIPAPPVATNAVDRFVVRTSAGLAVVTTSNEVWVHPPAGAGFGTAYQVVGPVPSVLDARAVLGFGDDLLFVGNDGGIQALHLSGAAGSAVPVAGQVDLGRAKWVTSVDDAVCVVDDDGKVSFYEVTPPSPFFPSLIVGPRIEAPVLSGRRSLVGTRAEDRFVVGTHDSLVVTTRSGEVFAHPFDPADLAGGVGAARSISGDWPSGGPPKYPREPAVTIGADLEAPGPEGAAISRVKFLVRDGNRLLSLAPQANAYRPTTLDGKPVGRKEGAVSGFATNEETFAFFTMRNYVAGCNLPEGCAHDDVYVAPTPGTPYSVRDPLMGCQDCSGTAICGLIQPDNPVPGGQTILGRATGDSVDFEAKSVFSTSKFLWAMPEMVNADSVPGMPELPSNHAVLVWGAGRENNYGLASSRWNSSAPYLAVTSIDQLRVQGGAVFRHPVANGAVGDAQWVGGRLAAGRPEDKYVFATGTRILVVTQTGEVFAHPYLNGAPVGDPIRLVQTSCGLVGTRPEDKWVLFDQDHLVVVTDAGQVWVHDVGTSRVENAYPYSTAVPVGLGAKHLMIVGGRLLAVYSDGSAVAYSIDHSARSIGPQIPLVQSPFEYTKIATRPEDRRVVGAGNRVYVFRSDGQVWTHTIGGNVVGPAQWMASTGPVASRPEDAHLLISRSITCMTPNCADEILVVTRPKWWFFAGQNPDSSPIWVNEERAATPLEPFGRADLDTIGYFSARYYPSLNRYVLLYTRPDPNRGVAFTTAPNPWGPWEEPVRIVDPADAYCNYMYQLSKDLGWACSAPGNNASEEGRRGAPQCATNPMQCRAWGGEYAPFLLPARYAAPQGATVPVYFELSTWNPYQVILMRTDVVTGL